MDKPYICYIHGEITEYRIYKSGKRTCKKCDSIRSRARREREQKWLQSQIKMECSKCGYDDCLASLHFHHIAGDKLFNVSRIMGYSRENRITEIKKCEIVCANCHSLEHDKSIALYGILSPCLLHSEMQSECKNCKNSKLRWYRQIRKLCVIDYFGNKCVRCNKTKHPLEYAFHHTKPANKKYNISDLLASGKFKLLVEELAKCIMICHNCHGEIEDNIEDKKFAPIPVEALLLSSLQTLTSNRGKKNVPPKICLTLNCSNTINRGASYCVDCAGVARRKITWPSTDEILLHLETKNYLQLGKQLGVSDNAIRKYLKRYGIVPPKAKECRT